MGNGWPVSLSFGFAALAVGWTPRMSCRSIGKRLPMYLGLTLEFRQPCELVKDQGVLEFHDLRHFSMLDSGKVAGGNWQ